MNRVFRKVVCSVVTAVFYLTQCSVVFTVTANAARAWGTPLSKEEQNNLSKSANSWGKDIANGFKDNAPQWDGGSSFTFRAGDSSYVINKDELAPSESNGYMTKRSDFEAQQDVWNDTDKMFDLGNKQKSALFSNALNEDGTYNKEATIEGVVYSLLHDRATRRNEDLSRDVMFQHWQDALDNLKETIEAYASCETLVTIEHPPQKEWIPDIQTCSRILDKSTDCTITHRYPVSVIEHESGPMNIKPCEGEPNCLQVWIGIVDNNYRCSGSTCRLWEDEIKFKVLYPELINKAVLWYTAYDDYQQVWIGKEDHERLIYEGPKTPFPFPAMSIGRLNGKTGASAGASQVCADECVQTETTIVDSEDECKQMNGTATKIPGKPAFTPPQGSNLPATPAVPDKWSCETCTKTEYICKNVAGRCELSTHWCFDPQRKGPTEGGGEACNYRTQTQNSSLVDITNDFKQLDQDNIVRFVARMAGDGCGESFASIKVYFDPSKIKDVESWINPECMDTMVGVDDGFAVGSVDCVQMPGEVDSNGCVTKNGYTICPSNFNTPPVDLTKYGISRLCQKIQVKSDYVHYKGAGDCEEIPDIDEWGNETGTTHTYCDPDVQGGETNGCIEIESRAEKGECIFKSMECSEGSRGASGACYVEDYVYDCGHYVDVAFDEATTSTKCSGVACMGEECVDVERTKNTNFGKIAGLMNVVEESSNDVECTGVDENGNPVETETADCFIFKGEAGRCKKGKLFGFLRVDCCKDHANVTAMDAISLAWQLKSLHNQILNVNSMFANIAQHNAIVTSGVSQIGLTSGMSLNVAATGGSAGIAGYSGVVSTPGLATMENVTGWYAKTAGDVSSVISKGSDFLASTFSSFYENTVGVVTKGLKWVSQKIDAAKKFVIDGIKDVAKKAVGKVIEIVNPQSAVQKMGEKTVAQATADKFVDTMSTYIGGAVMVIMAVYAAYNIMKMISSFMFKCHSWEFQLNTKRQAKLCHYVGNHCDKWMKFFKAKRCIRYRYTYCCFKTPLARIVNEQVIMRQPEVLGHGWGTSQSPNCEGIPMDKISEIDWDNIDLSEYMAMMVEADRIPTEEEDFSEEKMTGKDSPLNLEGKGSETGRDTVSKRSEDALQDHDVDQIRIQLARCFSLYLGSDQYSGGECFETTRDSVACRENGHLVSCDGVARDNMLKDLLGNEDRKTNDDYYQEGITCYEGGVAIDCTSLYDEKQAADVLEEYATIIGGSTYENKYVCTDKMGLVSERVCEAAMAANTCGCAEDGGRYVCRLGNQIIDCSELGEAKGDVECPEKCTKFTTEGYVCKEFGEDEEKIIDTSVPQTGYYCQSKLEEQNPEGISGWIIDKEPTCTEPGLKHRENLTTHEVVEQKPIAPVCTDDNAYCNKPQRCPLGGTLVEGTEDQCICNEVEPVCDNNPEACKYGGRAARNGSMDCVCNKEPDCRAQCPDFGGVPNEDGTTNCTCNESPSCGEGCYALPGTTKCFCPAEQKTDCTQSCANQGHHYGGATDNNGNCQCLSAPNCNDTSRCPNGGEPEENDTQDCSCYETPDDSLCSESYACGNKGGTVYWDAANDTFSCHCNP